VVVEHKQLCFGNYLPLLRSFWLSSNICFSVFFLNGNFVWVFLMRAFSPFEKESPSSVGVAVPYILGLSLVFHNGLGGSNGMEK